MRHPISLLLMACTLLPTIPAAGAEQIGRLFLTPQQRVGLERIRQGATADVKDEEAGIAIPAGSTIAFITVDGYVKRSGSKRTTTWINSLPQNENENPQGIAVLAGKANPSAVALRLPSGRDASLKAGQSIDVATGQVSEGYESGILVSDAPPTVSRKH